ncbi:hypothetical protein JW868_02545 [Candidatus Woesearchaeota archaeon]|nr:hypothetical protein [Candidatus Woesearchaeota archaeon]
MTISMPESMDDCFYFTRRVIGNGKVVCWVSKPLCPKCKKAKMGKPVEKGKVKIRATEYVCPSCNYTVGKAEFEPTLNAEAMYTCPHCRKEGGSTTPYKRKSIGGVQALRFACEHCGGFIDVTKKLAEKKK